MRALVVYESMFGNTQAIAEAVADGIDDAGIATHVVEVSGATRQLEDALSLLVVGGPTHAFGLSRASTRADAAAKTHREVISRRIGLREWLDGLERAGVPLAAAFSTRVRKPKVPGSAARALDKRLVHAGFRRACRPEDFWVDGLEGPLLEGELERARAWGSDLASAATVSVAPTR